MLDLLLQPYTVGEVIPLQARGILLCLVRYSKGVTKSRNIFRCFLKYPSDGWSYGVYRVFFVWGVFIYITYWAARTGGTPTGLSSSFASWHVLECGPKH